MVLQIDQLEAGVMTSSSPDVTHLIQQAASNQNNFIRQHLQHMSNSFTLLQNLKVTIETVHLDSINFRIYT